MVEAGNVLGVLAAVLLLIAGAAWIKVIRSPLLQRMDGSTEMDSAQGELASELLLWAVGMSTAAAILAIAGWIFG
jgi:hypothetical protein